MIIFTVRTHGPYAVTKCYLPHTNHTQSDGILSTLLVTGGHTGAVAKARRYTAGERNRFLTSVKRLAGISRSHFRLLVINSILNILFSVHFSLFPR